MRPFPEVEQQDGLVRRDVDGDGLVATMRLEDPTGPWKVSARDPRLMVQRGPDEFGDTYYYLLPEGEIQNWDGGKAFSNILGHIRSQYYDPRFMQIILGGILTTADRTDANCSTYRETRLLLVDQAAGGAITPEAAVAANAALDAAQAAYLATNYESAIDSLRAIEALALDPASGNSAAREELGRQATELREWMRTLQKLRA